MTEYTCERMFDYRLATQTMTAIWADIAEDDAPMYTPDIINEYWVGIYADDEYVGMYRLHQLNSVLWQGHVFMLDRKHSIGGGKVIQEWIIDNIEGLKKLIVEIPECFPNVIAFVEKLGLKKQGYNSDSYSKNGVIGTYQYGITIEGMKSWLQQQQS